MIPIVHHTYDFKSYYLWRIIILSGHVTQTFEIMASSDRVLTSKYYQTIILNGVYSLTLIWYEQKHHW